LEDHAKKLERITFHEKLGTVADKVERVAKLARWLVEEGIVKSSPSRSDGEGDHPQGGGGARPQAAATAAERLRQPPSASATSPSSLRDDREDRARLADLAEQAARLAKAELVTEMIGEFPELQGLMGGYYARAEGLPAEVADAIRDHYKPVGQGDEVPTAPVTVAVSLADKLDTLVGFFCGVERPTGSKDPFAQRRAAIAIIQLITRNTLHASLNALLDHAVEIWLQVFMHAARRLDPAVEAFVSEAEAKGRDIVDIIYSFGPGAGESLVTRLRMNDDGRHYVQLMAEF